MSRNRIVGLVVLGVLAAGCTSGTVASTTSTARPDVVTAVTTTDPVASTTTGHPPETTSDTVARPTTEALSELQIVLTEVDSGFNRPVLLVGDPGGGFDYVVEQPGRIVRADQDAHTVALDIRDDVRFEGEQGLLGLAFHPDFVHNALAYVNYVDTGGRTVVARFEVHDGVFEASPDPVVLRIDQPAGNHNGGMIAFGPEGHLWIGMGDGGKANDVFENGQNPHTLLGSMLRIGVPGGDQGPYFVPADNPYADGVDGAPEVYWTGLRNPWRFSFDVDDDGDGDVWIADVGQGDIEEVTVVRAGRSGVNLGWPVMEGSECFQSNNCDDSPYETPVTEYTHDEGCSITGGYVYRGTAIPELEGHFFYSDFCAGFIRSYSPETGDHDWTPKTGSVPLVSGFGVGGDGELHVVSHNGSIYRFERAK
jgi:glucose/arabinose dehydrogenase